MRSTEDRRSQENDLASIKKKFLLLRAYVYEKKRLCQSKIFYRH